MIARRWRGRVRAADFDAYLYWPDLDAIRAFAGDDMSVARFIPEDDRYLIERELTVRHDVVDIYPVVRD